jgi:hypothetical protein
VQSHAFLWTPKSGITDLGTVGADCFSAAFDINNKNQAVGLSISCDGNSAEAVLWENGRIINLNVFVPPGSGIDLEDVETITDRGELFGEAFLDNGESRAFLLIPCDDNHRNVEGCDYSMMEESPAVSVQQTVHGISGRRLLQQIHHPRLRPWGMGGLLPRPTGHDPTATLRDEGQMVSTPLANDLGAVEKPEVAREIPGEDGRSAQREADGEISSCGREERGASNGEVPALGYVVHGACGVNENASTLTGYCQGPILFSHTCSGGKDVSQCPSGQKAKEPEWITCGNFAVIRVDDKRPCEFVFK